MTSAIVRQPDETSHMANTVLWLGNVSFIVYPIQGTTWNDVPGVYIFAGQRRPGGDWYPIYVGKTKSFAERLLRHDREGEALQMGATAIHAKIVQPAVWRIALERDLIENYQPELNVLHR